MRTNVQFLLNIKDDFFIHDVELKANSLAIRKNEIWFLITSYLF